MTIEELKQKPIDPALKHFQLKSPGGIEFIGCLEEIKNPKSPVNWQLCSVVNGPLSLSEAMEWSKNHVLSTDNINQIESELMSRSPDPQPKE